MDVLMIVVAVFCAFGMYTALDMLRFRLLYPRRVRDKIRAAVIFDGDISEDAAVYADYLRREQKISSGRLIILTKNDIIEKDTDGYAEKLSHIGDVVYYTDIKEVFDDTERRDE